MPSRDLCKIHEGMFDKPEGLSHIPECFCIDPMEWHGITDLYHPREYGMIPRATPSGSSNGFIQGNMLNTPQAVPLICKASVVQVRMSWCPRYPHW